jgi:hypothetical protein
MLQQDGILALFKIRVYHNGRVESYAEYDLSSCILEVTLVDDVAKFKL